MVRAYTIYTLYVYVIILCRIWLVGSIVRYVVYGAMCIAVCINMYSDDRYIYVCSVSQCYGCMRHIGNNRVGGQLYR